MTALIARVDAAGVSTFVRSQGSPQVLNHVRVIDGTGSPGKDDQTIVIDRGRIVAIGNAGQVPIPRKALVADLPGRTVFPGLVGMHDHLFYQVETPGAGLRVFPSQSSFAKLYLGSGVTTIRTTGAVDFAGDVRLKHAIDHGDEPGPTVYLTSPYLDARGSTPDADRIAGDIASWAEQGATSVKAGPTLRAAELRAAVRAAHAHGMRITGHLCGVGFREAAAIGIDNLEHGLVVDTEFYSAKQPDVCPDWGSSVGELVRMEIRSAEVFNTITELVNHGVAVTSTLAVLETLTTRESALDPRTLTVLGPDLQQQYRVNRSSRMSATNAGAQTWGLMLRKEMEFERAFVDAGGRLLAGVDPTGWGGVISGFGDQRQLELLVEAGFTPEQAIRIATANGASFLLASEDIGTVAVGRRADLVVVRGNPSAHISDVRKVEWVIKDGVAYDPNALINATAGTVGVADLTRWLRWPLNVMSGLVIVLFAAWIIRKRTHLKQSSAIMRAAV